MSRSRRSLQTQPPMSTNPDATASRAAIMRRSPSGSAAGTIRILARPWPRSRNKIMGLPGTAKAMGDRVKAG